MNLQVYTRETNAGDRRGSWKCTVILAQTSVIPRISINGVTISVVVAIFVPLFKSHMDTRTETSLA